ncbi:hypothetical protein EHYA_03176 [Embleya hyalina]|uniref:Uncharacterized protein n=1 Tax=Embleya hyalina TaxID=516124 RepID=A0A401YLL2_9ACTN|nr:hypothetical protein EHYA_03176 [Embleya hyalina]
MPWDRSTDRRPRVSVPPAAETVVPSPTGALGGRIHAGHPGRVGGPRCPGAGCAAYAVLFAGVRFFSIAAM